MSLFFEIAGINILSGKKRVFFGWDEDELGKLNTHIFWVSSVICCLSRWHMPNSWGPKLVIKYTSSQTMQWFCDPQATTCRHLIDTTCFTTISSVEKHQQIIQTYPGRVKLMQNYAEMQWKFWTSETLTVSVWFYLSFLLLTWEVWSLIDGAILGFLAW